MAGTQRMYQVLWQLEKQDIKIVGSRQGPACKTRERNQTILCGMHVW